MRRLLVIGLLVIGGGRDQRPEWRGRETVWGGVGRLVGVKGKGEGEGEGERHRAERFPGEFRWFLERDMVGCDGRYLWD